MNAPPLVKTNIPYLVKDTSSGAIINTNKAGLEAARARKKSMERIDKVELEVANLSAEMKMQSKSLEKIAELLEQVVTRSGGR